MTKNPVPFAFVLDYLYPLTFTTRPMFGLTTIYVRDKIVVGLRDRPKQSESNGIWIATSKVHHESLKEELPSITSIPALGNDTGWQLLPAADDDFEAQAIKLCDLIKRNDPRIGKTPQPKKRKTDRK